MYYFLRSETREKIKTIYIHCRKYKIYIFEFWWVFLTCFTANGNELNIFRQYTYIVSIVVCQKPQRNCQITLKDQKQVSRPLWSPRLWAYYKHKCCYCFLPSLNMNQVPENYILVNNRIYHILVDDKANILPCNKTLFRIMKGVIFISPSFTRMVQAGW